MKHAIEESFPIVEINRLAVPERNAFNKYELWKDIIFRHGPEKLKEFKGFYDEKLKGNRKGRRASRLSLQGTLASV
jgi:hypothetical protein